jgi:CBS-domain-containing membrane protein
VFDPGSQWWLEFGRIRDEIQPRLSDCVADHMTQDIVSVTQETPLIVVLRNMIDARLHRVLVLDTAQRVCGIVSMTDVIAALLRAARAR